jgi:hypothetical protein
VKAKQSKDASRKHPVKMLVKPKNFNRIFVDKYVAIGGQNVANDTEEVEMPELELDASLDETSRSKDASVEMANEPQDTSEEMSTELQDGGVEMASDISVNSSNSLNNGCGTVSTLAFSDQHTQTGECIAICIYAFHMSHMWYHCSTLFGMPICQSSIQ